MMAAYGSHMRSYVSYSQCCTHTTKLPGTTSNTCQQPMLFYWN